MKLKKKIISISAAVLAAGALSVSAFAANEALIKEAKSASDWKEYHFDFRSAPNYVRYTDYKLHKAKSSGWAYVTTEHGTFGSNMPVTFYVTNESKYRISEYKTVNSVSTISLKYLASHADYDIDVYLRGSTEGTHAEDTSVSGDWKA